MARTVKVKLGKVTAALAGVALLTQSAVADRIVDSDYTLSGDEDWTADGKAMISNGVKVDLAGHRLSVGGFAEYIELPYVETDGRQWVNSRYKPAGTDKVEIKVRFLSDGNNTLYCTRSSTSATGNGFLLRSAAGTLQYGYRALKNTVPAISVTSVEDYVFVSDYSGSGNPGSISLSVNGNESTYATDAVLTPPGPFALFGLHKEGSSLSDESAMNEYASVRFYYMKVYDSSGNLKCDIVPAIGINEKAVGLYDRKRGMFLKVNGQPFKDRYPVLDWIETDGRQYVDTHFVPSWSNRVEMSVRMLSGEGDQCLFCSRNDSMKASYTTFALNNGNFRFDYSSNASCPFDAGVDYDIVQDVDISTGSFVMTATTNGAFAATVTGPEVTNKKGWAVHSFYLFAAHKGYSSISAKAKCLFRSFKVYNNLEGESRLLCDIVPCFGASEGAFGLYDRIAGRFLPSLGEAFPAPFAASVTNSAAGRAELEVNVASGAVTNSCVAFAASVDIAKGGAGGWTCAGKVEISGMFKPSAGTCESFKMLSGSTLDLSARSTPLDISENGISFEDGATVYLALGARPVSASTKLLSWPVGVPPANIDTLRFRSGDAVGSYRLHVADDGIYGPRGLVISFY